MREKDITQKKFFEDAKRFADFMNVACFCGRQVLKPEELEPLSISVLKADEQAVLERFCDVVKKQTKDGAVYAIYALENQETVDYGMLVRVMLEESLIYDKQMKEICKRNRDVYRKKPNEESMVETGAEQEPGEENGGETPASGEFLYGFRKSDRLTPVYTTVVYWGDKEWDGAKTLRELVDLPEEDEDLRREMLELLPDYRIKVFDLNKETDFAAFETSLKTVFEFYSRHNDGVAMKEYMDTHQEEVESLDEESRFFLSKMLRFKKWETVLNSKKKKKEKEEEKGMCKAIEELIAMGRQEGIEQGRAEAEQTITEAEAAIAELNRKLAEQKEKESEYLKLKKEYKKLRKQLAL